MICEAIRATTHIDLINIIVESDAQVIIYFIMGKISE